MARQPGGTAASCGCHIACVNGKACSQTIVAGASGGPASAQLSLRPSGRLISRVTIPDILVDTAGIQASRGTAD